MDVAPSSGAQLAVRGEREDEQRRERQQCQRDCVPHDAEAGDGEGVRRGEVEAEAEQTGGRLGRGEREDGPTLVAEIAHDASQFSFSGRSGSR